MGTISEDGNPVKKQADEKAPLRSLGENPEPKEYTVKKLNWSKRYATQLRSLYKSFLSDMKATTKEVSFEQFRDYMFAQTKHAKGTK